MTVTVYDGVSGVPATTPVATPAELIVAVGVLEEFQVTPLVRFCVV